MDAIRARALAEELIGKSIDAWKIESLVNNGKSAAVFRASKGDSVAAVKVFDRELIERFGPEAQLQRIKRELILHDKYHENIVPIYGGGVDTDSGLHYVAMGFIDVPNLEDALQEFDADDIPPLVAQLASAARYLEQIGLVHRDIKPSNLIWESLKKRLTVLDLGVLGPVDGVGSLTDVTGKPFIGTLRYSSPEFLLREEDNNPDGWRALTIYQIGAVMHDLIMRKPLFQEFTEPFAKLVNAVQFERPVIQSTGTPAHIIELSRICLLKKPELRLSMVKWSDFENLEKEPKSTAKERVTNRTVISKAFGEEGVSRIDEARQRIETELGVSVMLRDFVRTIRQDNSVFPPVTVIPRKAEAALELSFASSARHGLPDGLVLKISYNVLDAGESVVELTCKDLWDGESGGILTSFFKGVVDSAAVYASLEEMMYAAVDTAQIRASEAH